MFYIEGISYDPHFNLAMEQYIFDTFDKGKEYFMLWQNDNAIIVGKHQNTIQEINKEFVKENNISVVRRLSGGGAVYHDLGNLNFTFIVNNIHSNNIDFSLFTIPVAQALKEIGVNAEINGRNDITIEGKKFSGNSQYIKKGRVMHHGTIMYNSNLDLVSNSLKVSKDKIESKGVKSIKSRVTNVKDHMKNDVHIDDFKKEIIKYMFKDEKFEEYKLTEKDIVNIKKIKEERYDKWEWNYGNSPKYNILKERRFEGCGKIELYLVVENGKIKEFKSRGDYFGNGDTNDIEEKLIDCSLKEEDVRNAIAGLNIGNYYSNLSIEDFINLIIM